MREYKNGIPLFSLFFLAPLGVIIVFILAILNLNFASFVWNGGVVTSLFTIVAACVNMLIAWLFLVFTYLLILKKTRTWSLKTVTGGVIYLGVFQVFFLIFTLTDTVMELKNIIECLLYHFSAWSFKDDLAPDLIAKQKEHRDLWLTVFYFLGNSSLSALFTFFICRLLFRQKTDSGRIT